MIPPGTAPRRRRASRWTGNARPRKIATLGWRTCAPVYPARTRGRPRSADEHSDEDEGIYMLLCVCCVGFEKKREKKKKEKREESERRSLWFSSPSLPILRGD